MTEPIRTMELARKLEAERQRNEQLQAELEKSRCWARAWKRAAKSELEVVNAIQNLHRRRKAVGIADLNSGRNAEIESLKMQLAEARQQIKFLARECQRWEENAAFHQERTDELRLSVEDLERRLRQPSAQNGGNGHVAGLNEAKMD